MDWTAAVKRRSTDFGNRIKAAVCHCSQTAATATEKVLLLPSSGPEYKYLLTKRLLVKEYNLGSFKKVRTSLDKAGVISESALLQDILNADFKISYSSGKSGAVLLFSKDGKYIIKTVTRSEERFFLKKGISSYADYVEKNPHTLLVHFYMFFKFRFARTRKRFIVMNNVFNLGVHPQLSSIDRNLIKMQEVYDLKGSKVQRTASATEAKENSFKDNDLISRNTKIQTDEGTKQRILAQIRSDADLMKQLAIMDYSLMLGVFTVPLSAVTPTTLPNTTPFPLHVTVNKTQDQLVIYAIGIIDIMQEWNSKKKLAMALKSLVNNRVDLSTIPPAQYADRFVKFLQSNLF